LAGDKVRICVPIVNDDLEAVKSVEPLVDLFEVRIDLIGDGWREVAGRLGRPWLACNRRVEEDGRWQGSESARIEELLAAVPLGASIVDIELATPGVAEVVGEIKGRADCLISYHNLRETPPPGKMREIIEKQLSAGADICKLITTARSLADNLATLQLIKHFSQTRIVSFAMGALGQLSRVLCPLVGGYFTYASIAEGKESAAGQITAGDLYQIYQVLGKQ
jgi:3-dehydroquinate dehydratase-1